jgi:glutaredoxin
LAQSAGLHHAVTVYGTDLCEDTTRSRAVLDALDIEYNYYDIDKDLAMARTASALQNGGQKTPVIKLGEAAVLVEPSDQVLRSALHEAGYVI